MKILVTGGAGYIGSHTCIELIQAGHDVTVIDNLCNSSAIALDRVAEITGGTLRFVLGDVRSQEALEDAFRSGIDAVIHFAALKAVGESCDQPLRYFDNNVYGSISLIQSMERHGVRALVLSSSATVYGESTGIPLREDAPLRVTNPYGRSKLMMEQVARDWCVARGDVGVVTLRYFNPVGAHPSGRIGEDPVGVPNNLMPFIAQVAAGRRTTLKVFGNDYPTRDGTGIRDYLHVVDLARAHLKAVERATQHAGNLILNLGTGRGYSVLELISAFEKQSGHTVNYEIVARRPGDVASVVADPSCANEVLQWVSQFSLDQMCADGWRWQQQNPCGFSSC